MTPLYIPLTNVAGAVTSGKATLDLPRTWRYKTILLKIATTGTPANLPAVVTTITLKVDNRPQRIREAYQINQLNLKNSVGSAIQTNYVVALSTLEAYWSPGSLVAWTVSSAGAINGFVGVDGIFKNLAGKTTALPSGSVVYLPYCFSENFRKSYTAGDAMALPTFNKDGRPIFGSVQMEIQLGASAAAANAISASAEVDLIPLEFSRPGNPTVPMMSKWATYVGTSVASSEITINNLPRSQDQAFQALYLFTDSFLGAITTNVASCKVKANNTLYFDSVSKVEADLIDIRNGSNHAAQYASRYDISLDADDRVNSALALGNISEFTVTPLFGAGTAGIFHLAYDCYGPLW